MFLMLADVDWGFNDKDTTVKRLEGFIENLPTALSVVGGMEKNEVLEMRPFDLLNETPNLFQRELDVSVSTVSVPCKLKIQ